MIGKLSKNIKQLYAVFKEVWLYSVETPTQHTQWTNMPLCI